MRISHGSFRWPQLPSVLWALLASAALASLPGCPGKSSPPKPDPSTATATTGQAGTPLALGDVGSSLNQKTPQELAEERAERWAQRKKSLSAGDGKDALFADAERFEAEQNHKDAAKAFTAFLAHHPGDARTVDAAERAMFNHFRVKEYKEGLQLAEDAVFLVENTPNEARFRRTLGNTYLAIPHWGLTRGGEYLREQYGQGRATQSYWLDRKQAITHLEKARQVALNNTEQVSSTNTSGQTQTPDQPPPNKPTPTRTSSTDAMGGPKLTVQERDDVLFDLAAAVAKYTPYDNEWSYWYYAWGATPDDGLEEEGDGTGRSGRGKGRRGYYGYWGWQGPLQRAQPKGMEVTPDGQVVFDRTPEAYDVALSPTAKIKYLLQEIRALDVSEAKEKTGRAWVLQAALFRQRDGTERLQRLANWWHDGRHPYKEKAEDTSSLASLDDDEVLGLIATHIGRYRVPQDEAVPHLLQRAIDDAPKSSAAAQARWLKGAYLMSRRQYTRAEQLFEDYKKAHPQGRYLGSVNSALSQLRRQELMFKEMGVQPAGRRAQLKVTHRNLDDVKMTALPISSERILDDFKTAWKDGTDGQKYRDPLYISNLAYRLGYASGEADRQRYKKGKAIPFTAQVQRDPEHQYADGVVDTPLDKPGLYVVEAHHPEHDAVMSRGLVLVTGLSVVQKRTEQGWLVWVTDPIQGTPVAGAKVELFEHWRDYKKGSSTIRSSSKFYTTDKDGLVKAPFSNHNVLTIVRHEGKLGFGNWGFWGSRYHRSTTSHEKVTALVTDRPVYRPGDVVQLKAWVRKKVKGIYQPASSTKSIRIQINDAKGAQVFNETKEGGEWGETSIELALDDDAPLGRYTVQVYADGSYTNVENFGFQVEEYKAPEFTVVVNSAGEARLGDKVSVEVAADYLFGGGVAAGKVTYKVFRQDHKHTWSAAQPWDWLYGIGYGRCYYLYPWFSWWSAYGPYYDVWYPWWGPRPEPSKELVKEGQGKLDDKGRLKFDVDTQGAKANFGDTDHKYTVEVEVTDLSRRVIKGSGSVLVTRHPFQLSIEAKRGYVSAGQGVELWVNAQQADGKPKAVKGRILVEEVRFVGDNGATIVEEEREVIPVETQEAGPTLVTWKAKESGQYKFTVVAEAASGEEVKASTLSWVVGPGWNGNNYRMNGVELFTDKRSYKPGDVAKVLVNVDQAGASVLLGTDVENGVLVDYKMLRMKGKSQVVEVAITERHTPNFFIEATTTGNGVLHQEVRQLYVPPQKSRLHVDVKADKEEYGPGDEATLTVTTTDDDGKPVAADLALSVFDTAVLYIQEDLTPDIRKRFWARLKHHSLSSTSNLTQKFYVYGSLQHPDRQAISHFRSLTSGLFQQQVNFVHGGRGVKGAGLARVADEKQRQKRDDANKEVLAEEERSASGRAGGKKAKRRSRAQPAKKPAPSALRAESKSMAKDQALGDVAKNEAAPAAPAAEPAEQDADGLGGRGFGKGGGGAAPSDDAIGGDKVVGQKKEDVTVRSNFSDTAHFAPRVRTGDDGKATVSFKLPENLTTWRIKAIGLSQDTRAGAAEIDVRTSKDLLVRLQAPRFFRERDEVLVSAIVHNKLDRERTVDVHLDVNEHLQVIDGTPLKVTTKVGNKADKRVEWRVKVKGEGWATVRMTAVPRRGEGDAQQRGFPVLVHGLLKTVSGVGSIAADAPKVAETSITLDIPAERRQGQTKLTLRVSPTLAGAMLDALPYLLDYPYGCTEQTLSRFVPAVLTRKALQDAGGFSLEDLDKVTTNLNAQQLTAKGKVDRDRLARQYQRYDRSPVFNTSVMNDMIKSGKKRLAQMQNSDGGWGWWGSDESWRYTTAHVVAGLLDAKDSDLLVDSTMLNRGVNALERLVSSSLWRYDHHDWVGNEDAYAAWVLSRAGRKNDKLNGYLWERRAKLSAYGKLLAAMAFYNIDDVKKASTLLRNAEQVIERDDENETSWLETRKSGWWYWYNNDIETNAMWLRALHTIKDPKKDAPRVVKWLLNHRQNGWYWRSTRDTAQVIAAMALHMKKSKERNANYDLDVVLDGKVVQTLHVEKKNFLSFDGEVILGDDVLTSGKHKLTLRRKGQGAVYFNTYLEYFSLEEDVKAAGLEIKVDRKYFKLVRNDREVIRYGARGQKVVTKEVAYAKVPLDTGTTVDSGDLILVELMLESKNDYTFLAFEDPKPAGMEPVALKSGATYGEAVANMELRDEKVVFFLRNLSRGKLKLSYRLRAEIPGAFHAMPTMGFAMYAPELKANSDEMRVSIVDAQE